MSTYRLIHISDLHLSSKKEGWRNGLTGDDAWKWTRENIFKGNNILYPSTFDGKIGIGASDYIDDLADSINAVVITGDLSTTGELDDLSAAKNFLHGVPYGAWKSIIPKFPAIIDEEKSVCILPGNHDRYDSDILRSPGCINFEQAFGDDWNLGSANQSGSKHSKYVKRFVVQSEDDCLVICCVDLSLERKRDSSGVKGHLGQGVACSLRLDALVKETKDIREEYKNPVVIWAMHFPPSYKDVDKNLRLLNQDDLVDRIKEHDIDVVLAGHVHSQAHYPLVEYDFPRVICSGTVTSVDYNEDGANHFYEIEITTDNGRISEMKIWDTIWDFRSADFIRSDTPDKLINV